jgi:hypothetical protein
MARPYFTLACRDDAGTDAARWSPQFGDYDRAIVEDELEEYARDYRKADLKIVRSDHTQAAINAAIAKLNDWRQG